MSLLIPTNFLTLNILVAVKIDPPIRPQLGKCALQLLFQPERVWCSLSFSWPSVLWLQFLKLMKFLKLVRFSEDVSIFAISLQALKALSRPWTTWWGRWRGWRRRPRGWRRSSPRLTGRLKQRSPSSSRSSTKSGRNCISVNLDDFFSSMTPENIKPISFLFWMMFWSWLNGGRPSVKFVK